VIRRLSAYPARFVVVTDGSRGAWFGVRAGVSLIPSDHIQSFPVDAVDPTGAGDAFTAATISRLIRNSWTGLSITDVMYASAAGAIATTRRGAMSSLPREAEVTAFLNDRAGSSRGGH